MFKLNKIDLFLDNLEEIEKDKYQKVFPFQFSLSEDQISVNSSMIENKYLFKVKVVPKGCLCYNKAPEILLNVKIFNRLL